MLASEACSTGILLGFCRAMNKDVESKIKVSSQLVSLFLEPLKCETRIKVPLLGMQITLCLDTSTHKNGLKL